MRLEESRHSMEESRHSMISSMSTLGVTARLHAPHHEHGALHGSRRDSVGVEGGHSRTQIYNSFLAKLAGVKRNWVFAERSSYQPVFLDGL